MNDQYFVVGTPEGFERYETSKAATKAAKEAYKKFGKEIAVYKAVAIVGRGETTEVPVTKLGGKAKGE